MGEKLELEPRRPVLQAVKSVVIGCAAMVWFYGITPLKRNIYWALQPALVPLSFLFFIYLYGGRQTVSFALAGGLVMVTVSAGIVMETEAAFNRLVLKLQDMYVSSPISPIVYVLGLAIANEAYAVPGFLIFIALTEYFIGLSLPSLLTIFFALTLTWASFATIGFIISTRAKDIKDLWTWSPIVTMFIDFLPPVFYPLELLPHSFRWIVFAVPTAAASRLIQASLGAVVIGIQESVALWAALIFHTAVATTVLLKRIRWREA